MSQKSVEKISAAVAAAQSQLVDAGSGSLAAGVAFAKAAYDAAVDAHAGTVQFVTGAVSSSLYDYNAAYAQTSSDMQAIIEDLRDNADPQFLDSLGELVTAVVATSSISGSQSEMKTVLIDFQDQQAAATAGMKSSIGRLSEAEAVFDGAYNAGWETGMQLP